RPRQGGDAAPARGAGAAAGPYTEHMTAHPARNVEEELFLNPFETGFFDNPYDQYRRLRELRPVHKSPVGPWTLTRYEDCSRLLRDPSMPVEIANAAVAQRSDLFPEEERR